MELRYISILLNLFSFLSGVVTVYENDFFGYSSHGSRVSNWIHIDC